MLTYELENMLRDGSRRRPSWLRRWFGGIHDTMHPSFLKHSVPLVDQILRGIYILAPTVPQTTHVVPRDDLRKSPRLDVANFDKASIE